MTTILTNAPTDIRDWEEGDLTDADASGANGDGAVAASNAQAYGGSTWSAHCEVDDTSAASYADTGHAITFPVADIAFARAFLYIVSLGTSEEASNGKHVIFGFSNDADGLNVSGENNAMMMLNIKCSDGSLWVTYRDNVAQGLQWDTGADLSTGQWYEIEIKFDVSGENLQMSVFVDGTEYTKTGGASRTVSPLYLTAGAMARWVENAGKDLYWDSIEAADERIGTPPAEGAALPIFAQEGIHSLIFGGQVVR